MRLGPTLTLVITAAIVMYSAEANATVLLDRLYRFGDSPDNEGATNNGSVRSATGTFDDAHTRMASEAVDLLPAAGDPRYATITGRPDGQGGFGVRFDGNDALHGARLGAPSTSVTSIQTNNYDYSGISDRGFEVWVNVNPFNPQTTGVQSIVLDTNQHGLQINDAGNFAMRYAGTSFDSGVSAAAGGWFHAMVARPSGAAGGSRMYINGNAVAFAAGDYSGNDTADLVVGANTGGNGEIFEGANAEFFSGVVDDLKMFVIGNVMSAPNPDTPGVGKENFLNQTVQSFTSRFDLSSDNDFIFFKRTENVAGANPQPVGGDLNLDGIFDGHLVSGADRSRFTAGWFSRKFVNGRQLGDLSTFQNGDINFDGITNIFDLVQFQSLIAAQPGGAAVTAAELHSSGSTIPEPASALLAILQIAGMQLFLHPRRRTRR